MNQTEPSKKLAIIGGGPAAMFLYKTLVDLRLTTYSVHIFEAGQRLGAGMPYSDRGALPEHITNISGNEIPALETSVVEWLQSVPESTLAPFNIDRDHFTAYKVLPRLLFGQYLEDQFEAILKKGKKLGINTVVHKGCRVADIIDQPMQDTLRLSISPDEWMEVDEVVICTGHAWPKKNEGKVPGYYDSPYPPAKLLQRFNHPIAIKGSSLTAIDALRTLARAHGRFEKTGDGQLRYLPDATAKEFTLVMYSINGLLPGIRFHLEDPRLVEDGMLTDEEINAHMARNNGFLSLDYIFDKDFKALLRKKDPAFYAHVKDMTIEQFTQELMGMRERMDPFLLFRLEYEEARQSIRKKESVHWKELLAGLSFAMNYPAKHLSAEDMLRLTKVLMPLISIVIAFVPQSSCEELIALHNAGRLKIIPVTPESGLEINDKGEKLYKYIDEDGQEQQQKYETYIDCTGQPRLSVDQFPFKGLLNAAAVQQATLPFRSAKEAKQVMQNGGQVVEQGADKKYYLQVPGIAIADSFRVVSEYDKSNPRIHIMAVPFIGGYNPDYSGLDFCEEAAKRVVEDLLQHKGEQQAATSVENKA